MVDFGCLLPALGDTVKAWLKEDIPSFDYGGAVVGDAPKTATLWCKSPGVMAGKPFFDAVFAELGCTVTWAADDGDFLDPTTTENGKINIATVAGPARKLLMGERTALNVLARASGIATKAREFSSKKAAANWGGVVAGTRKITPGFRMVEKHAMLVGGADCHRMDLSSMVMLKDNHIWSEGSITKAVQKARSVCGFSLKIEVECNNVTDAEEAIAAGADVIMLDNQTPAELAAAAATLKGAHPHIIIEGSGGITGDTIQSFMVPNVDVLSTSAIHQGVPHVDFSLKIAHDDSVNHRH